MVSAADSLSLLDLPQGWQHIAAGWLDLRALTDLHAAAHTYLSSREQLQWQMLAHPARRTEWLGARMCLKALVVGRLDRNRNPRELTIEKDHRGRPWLCTDPLGQIVVGHCSLAHAATAASAAWTLHPLVHIGIDVEQITPRLLRAAGAFRSPFDTAIVRRPELEQLAIWWTLKEAASKAWGEGLGAGLSEIRCAETTPGHHRVSHSDGRTLAGWHCTFDNYSLAVCASDCDEATETVALPPVLEE